MDVDSLISSHVAWKHYLRGLIEAGEVGPDDWERAGNFVDCDLGQWIRSFPTVQGQGGPNSAILDVDRHHRAFHAAAQEVLRSIMEGGTTDARAILGPQSPYSLSSHALIVAVRSMTWRRA